mgnify:CR=1 FL=1
MKISATYPIILFQMELSDQYFYNLKEKAKGIFQAQKSIYNPYFKEQVILNSDGIHHLLFSARKERSRAEQIYKLRLLPLALEIIRKSGTIQEYRKILSPVGEKSFRGELKMKEVEYWGLVAIIGEKKLKVRSILRRIGNGNITFWSVMLYSKRKNGQQKLFDENLDDT